MPGIDARAEDLRRFNRFYTEKIGVLGEGLLQSRFSLAEARVLYEISHSDGPAAAVIGKRLNLDPGYLSRIVKRLSKAGLLSRTVSPTDSRERRLSLTKKGRDQFAVLDHRSHAEAAALLRPLPHARQLQLVEALAAAQSILGGTDADRTEIRLRSHRPGDMGWVVQRHGELYFQEYGWDERFEALVAKIAADFVTSFDPTRERCWIAERNGERVGCIFLVRKSERVAKLRLLLVSPEARGSGLGRRLVDECLAFARHA
ncbi:MAG TPA: bifunctional helix-turn-helix transcriptional regulator/GNAT family N-acetyltransferase, partial [Bryobacteraceae bacterium]|nr:bifunctional helix-turn-helix transcriptional regulator/GNAT family N-acetyltransferase [Bryobacteraceae bacterium]